MWSQVSKYFFKGLIILLPFLITLWLLKFIFSFMDDILGSLLTVLFGRPIPGLGLLITLAIVFITGYFANYIVGERLIQAFERFMFKVPIVKSIYSSAKQVNEVLFQSGDSKGFNKACLVQYPRLGIYSIGFLTNEAGREINEKANKTDLVCVFIPNTPTPATGFLIMVPRSELIMLDIKIDEAFKMIVSGGALTPKKKA